MCWNTEHTLVQQYFFFEKRIQFDNFFAFFLKSNFSIIRYYILNVRLHICGEFDKCANRLGARRKSGSGKRMTPDWSPQQESNLYGRRMTRRVTRSMGIHSVTSQVGRRAILSLVSDGRLDSAFPRIVTPESH